jgi:hypothetical protein
MPPSSPYQTLGDIRLAIIKDTKETTSSTFVSLVDRWINEGYEQVAFRKKRDWLDEQFTVQVKAKTEATATVTNNSSTVTFATGTTFPTGVELQFQATGFAEVYDVSSATLNVVTLAKPYLGDSSTAATGTVFQPHIILDADIRHVYQVYHQHNDQPLVDVGPQQMRQLQETSGVQYGKAKYFTIFGQSSGQRRLVIYPYPDEAYTIYIDANVYVPELTSSTDEPLMPIQYRQALYWYGLHKAWMYERNYAQAESALANFNSMLTRMDGEMRAEIEFPQISVSYPRSKSFRRFKPRFDPRLRDD